MATNEGFIPIFRSIFEHEFWNEKRSFSKFEAWIWLIKEARYTNKPGRKCIAGIWINYDKGQIPASLEYLRRAWNWGSTGKVDRFLNYLSQPKNNEKPMIYMNNNQGVTVIGLAQHEAYNAHLYQAKEQTINQTTPKLPKIRKPKDPKLKELTKNLIEYWNQCNQTRLTTKAKGRMSQVRQRLQTFNVKEIKQAISIRAAQPWTKANDQQSNWDAVMNSDKKLDHWLNRSIPEKQIEQAKHPTKRGFYTHKKAKEICTKNRKEFSESNCETYYHKPDKKWYYKPLFNL